MREVRKNFKSLSHTWGLKRVLWTTFQTIPVEKNLYMEHSFEHVHSYSNNIFHLFSDRRVGFQCKYMRWLFCCAMEESNLLSKMVDMLHIERIKPENGVYMQIWITKLVVELSLGHGVAPFFWNTFLGLINGLLVH